MQHGELGEWKRNHFIKLINRGFIFFRRSWRVLFSLLLLCIRHVYVNTLWNPALPIIPSKFCKGRNTPLVRKAVGNKFFFAGGLNIFCTFKSRRGERECNWWIICISVVRKMLRASYLEAWGNWPRGSPMVKRLCGLGWWACYYSYRWDLAAVTSLDFNWPAQWGTSSESGDLTRIPKRALGPLCHRLQQWAGFPKGCVPAAAANKARRSSFKANQRVFWWIWVMTQRGSSVPGARSHSSPTDIPSEEAIVTGSGLS